jgi:hypothetical protein
MSGFIEHIRMEIDGPPQLLLRHAWTGPSPSRDSFLEIASIALRGYFIYEGHGLQPKDEFGAFRDKPPVAEAIRFILDDGSEQYRYDLHDMVRDNWVARDGEHG